MVRQTTAWQKQAFFLCARCGARILRLRSAPLMSISDPDTILIAVELLVIGAIGGFGGGLLGIGGGLTIIPLLTIAFGPNQHQYTLLGLIASTAIGASSAIGHLASGAVDRVFARRVIAWSAPAAVLAAIASSLTPERPLRITFALLLIVVGLIETYRFIRKSADGTATESEALARGAWKVGLPMGVISGLLGVGGGVIAVPILSLVIRLPMKRAVATSAVAVLGTVTVALLATIASRLFDPPSAIRVAVMPDVTSSASIQPSILWWSVALCAAGVALARTGSRATHRLPVRAIRGCFIAVLFFFAWRMAAV